MTSNNMFERTVNHRDRTVRAVALSARACAQRHMICILALAALGLIGVSWNASAAGGELLRKPPYVYCNVILHSACFGIDGGDKLTMSLPADFVLYRVEFSFGRSALIYVGNHPDVDRRRGSDVSDCRAEHGFAKCFVRAHKGGKVELLGESYDGSFLHAIVAEGEGREAEIESFIANIRGCTSQGDVVTCAPSRAKGFSG
jgi:hypothetical protein